MKPIGSIRRIFRGSLRNSRHGEKDIQRCPCGWMVVCGEAPNKARWRDEGMREGRFFWLFLPPALLVSSLVEILIFVGLLWQCIGKIVQVIHAANVFRLISNLLNSTKLAILRHCWRPPVLDRTENPIRKRTMMTHWK